VINHNGKGKNGDGQPMAKKRHMVVVAPQQRDVQSRSSNRPEEDRLEREMRQPNVGTDYQFTGVLDDIDRRDVNDPLSVTDYVNDMYEHFRMKENLTSVKPTYMENQGSINEKMRSILVDWLIEVHMKFKLVPDTLYLTVNIIDRFLEREDVSRPNLQLLGVTSLFLASKYEEIYPPEVSDLIYICDRAYCKEEIIAMEELVLKVLSYNMTVPTAHIFLVRYLKAAHADRKMVQIACYVLDGTLASYTLLHYRPSQLAAAAVMIARKALNRNAWSPTLRKYACYDEEDILPAAKAIVAEKTSRSIEYSGLEKKYSSSRFGSIARQPIDIDF
jgi:cyclin B